MASRNYTRPQAARIARTMMRQLLKMWDDDYITRNQWMKATDEIEKVFRHLKKK
tara:strand:+ start:73 stop:234 length:162 start_codon:yes stop_codon:yes gene_type:complete